MEKTSKEELPNTAISAVPDFPDLSEEKQVQGLFLVGSQEGCGRSTSSSTWPFRPGSAQGAQRKGYVDHGASTLPQTKLLRSQTCQAQLCKPQNRMREPSTRSLRAMAAVCQPNQVSRTSHEPKAGDTNSVIGRT